MDELQLPTIKCSLCGEGFPFEEIEWKMKRGKRVFSIKILPHSCPAQPGPPLSPASDASIINALAGKDIRREDEGI